MVTIFEYLWQIDINLLKLGWDDVYQHALAEFPDGTFFDVENYDGSIEETFTDPVICRNLLLNGFKDYSKKAENIFNKLSDGLDKELLNKLISYDSILYTILSYWLDDLLNLQSLDPKGFMEELVDSSKDHYLYTLTNPNPNLEFIDQYRLLSI